jgi:tetratricopeptide (TPR) repeat protein
MAKLAVLYDDVAKYAQEEALLASTSSTERRVLGDSHPETLSLLSELGRVQLRLGKFTEAEATLSAALGAYRSAIPGTWQRYNCETLLGRALAAQKKFSEAELLELSGYWGMVHLAAFIPAPDRHLLRGAEAAIPRLCKDWGKPQNALEWKRNSGGGPSAPHRRVTTAGNKWGAKHTFEAQDTSGPATAGRTRS